MDDLDWKVEKLVGLQFETLAGITFSNAIQNCEWLRKVVFFPSGWAVEYTFLLILFRILNAHHFKNILEFGLGESSKMVHQYSTFYKSSALSIEHDYSWRDYFFSNYSNHVTVEMHPLKEISFLGKRTITYDNLDHLKINNKFDLIIVDGPKGSKHYSRSQIIDFAEDSLADSFCIMIDDCDRQGELETLQIVLSVLQKRNIDFLHKVYKGFHNFAVVCSSDLRFLCSLGV
jgi:hypothetical protein